MGKIDRGLEFVAQWEGGEVNDPNDPGGHTNHGVTQRTLDAFKNRYPDIQMPDSVADLTLKKAQIIFRMIYWNPIRGDDLPDGLALMLFDASINQGTSDAPKFLQRAIGVEDDGIIGPITLGKLKNEISRKGEKAVIRAVAVERARDYALNDSIDDYYARGWYRRLFDCYDVATGE